MKLINVTTDTYSFFVRTFKISYQFFFKYILLLLLLLLLTTVMLQHRFSEVQHCCLDQYLPIFPVL